MSTDVENFITAVTALADSPLPKFFAALLVLVVLGYLAVVLDTARRTVSRRR